MTKKARFQLRTVWISCATHVALYGAESFGLVHVDAARVCVHQITRYACLALLHTEQIPPGLSHLETLSNVSAMPMTHARGGVDNLVPPVSRLIPSELPHAA